MTYHKRPSHHPLSHMPVTTALCEALNQGISSGNFIDTKIILYSRGGSSSRVYRPKALYANSHALGIIPYFKDRGCLTAFDPLGGPHGIGLKYSLVILWS